MADPALDQLLFVIALIKGAVTLACAMLLRWRLREPIAVRRRVRYLAALAMMTVGTALLGAHRVLGAVPVLFDGGAAVLMLTAITDTRLLSALAQRFPSFRAVRVRRIRRARLSHRRAPDTVVG